MTKADQLAHALDEFLAVSPEVEAAAIVSADGLPMASALPPNVEEDRIAAMGAALLTLGERAAAGLGKGDLAQVFVEGEDGYVFLMAAGPDAVLVSITAKRAKVGLVLFEMRKSAKQVAAVMEQGAPPIETPAYQAPSEHHMAEHPPAPEPFAESSTYQAPEHEEYRAPAPAETETSVSGW